MTSKGRQPQMLTVEYLSNHRSYSNLKLKRRGPNPKKKLFKMVDNLKILEVEDLKSQSISVQF